MRTTIIYIPKRNVTFKDTFTTVTIVTQPDLLIE